MIANNRNLINLKVSGVPTEADLVQECNTFLIFQMPGAIKGNPVFEFANAVYFFGVAISSLLLGGVNNAFVLNEKQLLILVKRDDYMSDGISEVNEMGC